MGEPRRELNAFRPGAAAVPGRNCVLDGQKPPLSHELPESCDDELLHESDDESEADGMYTAAFIAVVSGAVLCGRYEEPVFFRSAFLSCFFDVIPASFPPGILTSPDLRNYRGFLSESCLIFCFLTYAHRESSRSRRMRASAPTERSRRAATFLPL